MDAQPLHKTFLKKITIICPLFCGSRHMFYSILLLYIVIISNNFESYSADFHSQTVKFEYVAYIFSYENEILACLNIVIILMLRHRFHQF